LVVIKLKVWGEKSSHPSHPYRIQCLVHLLLVINLKVRGGRVPTHLIHVLSNVVHKSLSSYPKRDRGHKCVSASEQTTKEKETQKEEGEKEKD